MLPKRPTYPANGGRVKSRGNPETSSKSKKTTEIFSTRIVSISSTPVKSATEGRDPVIPQLDRCQISKKQDRSRIRRKGRTTHYTASHFQVTGFVTSGLLRRVPGAERFQCWLLERESQQFVCRSVSTHGALNPSGRSLPQNVPSRVFDWKADPSHGGESVDGWVTDRSRIVEGVLDQKRLTMPHHEPAEGEADRRKEGKTFLESRIH